MKFVAIKENHLYAKAYQKGKKFVGQYVIVYTMPDYKAKLLAKANPMHKTLNRIGITVSKKLGGAVERNRSKRVIREAYRKSSAERKIKQGFLLVFVARTACVTAKSDQIAEEFTRAFSSLGLTLC